MFLHPILGALFTAATATAGDYVWATRFLPHRTQYGIVHGAALCLAIGLVLGLSAGRPVVGALGGILVGILSAGLFYLLTPLMAYSAMFVAWMALWLLFGCLYGPVLRRTSWGTALGRGAIAAALSGAAFYLVSGMWTDWNPRRVDYANHFMRWIVAFLPGFLALMYRANRHAKPV
jgi:hypothetical protein